MKKKCTKAILSGKSTKPIGIQPKKKFDFCLHNIKTLHIFAEN